MQQVKVCGSKAHPLATALRQRAHGGGIRRWRHLLLKQGTEKRDSCSGLFSFNRGGQMVHSGSGAGGWTQWQLLPQRGGSHAPPWKEVCFGSYPGSCHLPPEQNRAAAPWSACAGADLRGQVSGKLPQVREAGGAQEGAGPSAHASGKADAVKWGSRLRVPPRTWAAPSGQKVEIHQQLPTQPAFIQVAGKGRTPLGAVVPGPKSSRSPTASGLKPRRPLKPAVLSFYVQILTLGR